MLQGVGKGQEEADGLMFVSYAQNFEDVLLWRALKHVKKGFYIDVGAHSPSDDSVSLAFYERGWRGVHVEPVPLHADRLRAARPDEEVVEAAIANEEGVITFFDVPNTGLGTGNTEVAERHQSDGLQIHTIEVNALTLGSLLDRYRDKEIHWLKIDVEGMEAAVVESWPPSSVRPWLIVIESTRPRSQEQNFSEWEPGLLELGYEFALFDGLNRFYVHERHAHLADVLHLGANFFDDFAVGGNSPYARKLNADIAALNRRLEEKGAEIGHLAHLVESARTESEVEKTSFAQATQAWHAASAALSAELVAKNEAIAMHLAEIARLHQHIVHSDAAHAQQIGTVQADLARREQEIATHLVEIDRLRRHISSTDEVHAHQIARLRARLAASDEVATAQQAEIEGLRDRIAEMEASRTRQLAAVQADLAMRDAILAARRSDLEERDSRLASLSAAFEAASQRADELDRALAGMLTSNSWRITAPLRLTKGAAVASLRLPITATRVALEQALFRLRRWPKGAALVKRGLRIVPPLERRLLAFSRARTGDQTPQKTAWALDADPEITEEWRRLLTAARKA